VCPYALVLALDTLAWRVLVPGRRVTWSALVRARLAGEAVNMTTPTASVGGEPLKAYLLRPWLGLGEAMSVVILDKTTVVAGQGLFLAAGLALAAVVLPPGHPVALAMTALLAVEIAAVGGFILVQTLGVFGGSARLLARVGLGPGEGAQQGLTEVDRRLQRFYRERRGRIVLSTVLHGLASAGTGVEIYLALAFLERPAPLSSAIVVESFGAAVKFASFMVPASLGALEGGYLAFFGAFGIGGAVALSYSLVRRLREATWVALGFLALLAAGRPRAPLQPDEHQG
jgi:uncharacterized membrane protein YbhN (UPF0104 family)